MQPANGHICFLKVLFVEKKKIKRYPIFNTETISSETFQPELDSRLEN